MDELNLVCAYCADWGVEIVKNYGMTPNDKGPYWGGINWPQRQIFWRDGCENSSRFELMPSAMLHELAHVLADTKPRYVDEVGSSMLAFEYYSSKFLRLKSYEPFMQTYCIEGDYWFDIAETVRTEYLNESFKECTRLGLLDKQKQPTFTRK